MSDSTILNISVQIKSKWGHPKTFCASELEFIIKKGCDELGYTLFYTCEKNQIIATITPKE